MNSYTFNVGAAYRRQFMIRLDELGLPYKEHRTLVSSTIIVQTYTERQEDAFYRFSMDVSTFVLRLNAVKQQRKLEEMKAERAKKLKKQARKNFFRKMTFRKPLK